MKIFVLVFFLVSQSLFSQPDLLKSGNSYFAKAMYKEAIDAYKQVESKNLGGFGLYSNMARSYANLHQEPLAILYFEKALALRPNDDMIKKELNKIRQLNPNLDPTPDLFFVQKWWISFTGIFLPGTWAYISLSSMALIALFFLWKPAVKGPNKLFVAGIMCVGLVFLISITSAYYRDQQIYHNNNLIITKANVKMKVGPDPQSPDITELPPGAKVYKKDYIDSWTQITNEYGDIGWIKTEDAIKI